MPPGTRRPCWTGSFKPTTPRSTWRGDLTGPASVGAQLNAGHGSGTARRAATTIAGCAATPTVLTASRSPVRPDHLHAHWPRRLSPHGGRGDRGERQRSGHRAQRAERDRRRQTPATPRRRRLKAVPIPSGSGAGREPPCRDRRHPGGREPARPASRPRRQRRRRDRACTRRARVPARRRQHRQAHARTPQPRTTIVGRLTDALWQWDRWRTARRRMADRRTPLGRAHRGAHQHGRALRLCLAARTEPRRAFHLLPVLRQPRRELSNVVHEESLAPLTIRADRRRVTGARVVRLSGHVGGGSIPRAACS